MGCAWSKIASSKGTPKASPDVWSWANGEDSMLGPSSALYIHSPFIPSFLLSAVSVTRGQLWSENMKWKITEMNDS